MTRQPIRIVRRVGAFVAKHGAAPKYDGMSIHTDLYL